MNEQTRSFNDKPSRLNKLFLPAMVAGSLLFTIESIDQDTTSDRIQPISEEILTTENSRTPVEVSNTTTTTVLHSTVDSREETTTTLPANSVLTAQANAQAEREVVTSQEVIQKSGKIAIFGDSITNGYGLTINETTKRWVDIVSEDIRRVYPKVTIHNYSVAGQSIVSDRPTQIDKNGITIGGRLFDLAASMYPEGTPQEQLPDVAVITPSINEIIVSRAETEQEKVDLAVAGLQLTKTYLQERGIGTVIILPMLEPSQDWDDTTPMNVIETIKLLNQTLVDTGLSSNVTYSIDIDGLPGADNQFFTGYDGTEKGDGLHPNGLGHRRIAESLRPIFYRIIEGL